MKRVADTLHIPLEEVRDTHQQLLDILYSLSSLKITLPVNEAILDLAKTVWQTLSSVAPICKCEEKQYYIPTKESEFLFSHPSPNSIVVDAVKSCDNTIPGQGPLMGGRGRGVGSALISLAGRHISRQPYNSTLSAIRRSRQNTITQTAIS